MNARQQLVVDDFRASYEQQNPDVQAAIARAVSFAERNLWPLLTGALIVGFLAGAGWAA